jgi:CshA-type fibril repeat protein
MSNTLGAVNILDLSGKDGNGDAVNRFIITSLPSANQGVLYMADGTTRVHVNQTLTLAEANGLRFDPTTGFVGNVTFTYVALDDNGIKSTNATVTIPLINPINNLPTADDKVNPKMLNTLGAVNILDLSGKDSNGDAVNNFIITSLPDVRQGVLYMADGTTAVSLNQELTLAEANGLRFDPNIDFVGEVRFSYVAVDSNGVKSSNARVTIPVVASYNTDIVTHDDMGVANGNSNPIVIDVLANDTGTLTGATVRLVNTDGTFTDEVTVDGEGVWSVNSDNMVVFTPVAPFVGTPSSMDYLVRDANGAVSNTSTVTINGQCVCKPYREDIPVFSTFGLFLMMLLSMIVGLRLIKKEL